MRDGISQTPLTLALQMEHFNTAKLLIEIGSTTRGEFFEETISPLEIALVKKNDQIISMIERKNSFENDVIAEVSLHFPAQSDEDIETLTPSTNYARSVNITVGDQKNTVTVQTCANDGQKNTVAILQVVVISTIEVT